MIKTRDHYFERESYGLSPLRSWTEADQALLLRLVEAKVSRKLIAAEFCVSVNAVNGVLFRIRHGQPVGPKPSN